MTRFTNLDVRRYDLEGHHRLDRTGRVLISHKTFYSVLHSFAEVRYLGERYRRSGFGRRRWGGTQGMSRERGVQAQGEPTTETQAALRAERVAGWLRVPLIIAALLAIPTIIVSGDQYRGILGDPHRGP
jgi:hypothetical protein